MVGTEDGNKDNRDKGSSYKWCDCKGGRWLAEPLVAEAHEKRVAVSPWQVEVWVAGNKSALGGKTGQRDSWVVREPSSWLW